MSLASGEVMDQKVITLIIGLAGIIATLISSGLGLYFISKARSAPLREALFKKQLDLISRIIHKQGRIRVFATIMGGENDLFKDKARDDIRECVREFSEMQDEAAAILPTELFGEIKRLTDHVVNILVSYDTSNKIDPNSLTTLAAIEVKIALISRKIIGVDELTGESLSLFSNKKHYDNLTNIEIEEFERISKRINT